MPLPFSTKLRNNLQSINDFAQLALTSYIKVNIMRLLTKNKKQNIYFFINKKNKKATTFPSCNNKFLMIQQLVTSLDYLLTDCLKNKLILLKLEPIKHKTWLEKWCSRKNVLYYETLRLFWFELQTISKDISAVKKVV
jgi:hypothetical protein